MVVVTNGVQVAIPYVVFQNIEVVATNEYKWQHHCNHAPSPEMTDFTHPTPKACKASL